MSDNLSLWNAVEKTPLDQTKPITGKSYSGTSPKPHYLVHKATETFGPCGIGWGFTIEDERIEDGAGGERMSIARVKVWYEWNGKRGEVEHIGGMSFSGMRKNGNTFTDEDAPKKSVTDALIKALSMIGFAGDIFMGRYDDSKYVADLKEEQRERQTAEKPENKAVSAAHQKRCLAQIDQELLDCRTPRDVEKLVNAWAEQAEREGWSRDYWNAALAKFKQRKAELVEAPNITDDFPGDRRPPDNAYMNAMRAG